MRSSEQSNSWQFKPEGDTLIAIYNSGVVATDADMLLAYLTNQPASNTNTSIVQNSKIGHNTTSHILTNSQTHVTPTSIGLNAANKTTLVETNTNESDPQQINDSNVTSNINSKSTVDSIGIETLTKLKKLSVSIWNQKYRDEVANAKNLQSDQQV